METILTWFAITVAGLVVSAHTRVNLPVLGPTPVIALVVMAMVLTFAVVLLLIARAMLEDWRRVPRMVTP
jgi:hypothetical protein